VSAESRQITVVDADPAWERVVLAPHRVVRVAPADAGHVDGADGTLLVNLASPHALDVLATWPARRRGLAWGCVTSPGSEHLVRLGGVAVVTGLRPADPVAAYVRRRSRRRLRVVATGPNAGALLALRRVLAGDGIGVSLAWDAGQARDLCELVHPHAVVVDLGVSRGGHDLVVWLGLRRIVPDLVLVPSGDDSARFTDAFAVARRQARLPLRREAVAALVAGTTLRVA
jgi:hypothetical protein